LNSEATVREAAVTREGAEALMRIYTRVGVALNEAHAVIEREPDEDVRRALRRPLGIAMSDLWVELQLPLVSEYPDLDPDRENGPK
jgi:hypothetical protein